MSKTFTTKNKKYVPYTYLVGWTELDKYYYGVRYSRKSNPENFWKDYFTSSEYVKEYREKYGEPDILQIRKTFENADDAILWEHKVLRKLLSQNNENRSKWLNICVGQGTYSITDECIEKISNGRKRYIENRTPEQEERDYESRLRAANSEESKRKISEKAKERFEDPEYRKHFEDNVWNNPDFREKLRKNTTEWFSDEDNKAEWLKTVQTEEYRNKQGKDSKERHDDPVYRAKWLKSMQDARESDPDYIKKKSEAAKKCSGNVLATKNLKRLTKDVIDLHTEESIIKFIEDKLKGKYEFDHDKLLEKFRLVKALQIYKNNYNN